MQTQRKSSSKKTHSEAPPFQHSNGQWAKKRDGKMIYLGSVADDPTRELADARWEDVKRNRQQRANLHGLQLHHLINKFLDAKDAKLLAGELSPRSFGDYVRTGKLLAAAFGRERRLDDLLPEDWLLYRAKLGKTLGLHGVSNEVARVRVIFNWGWQAGLLAQQMRFGPEFKKPSAKIFRVARATKPAKLLQARQVRRLIKHASPHLAAMIALGINCGLGNADVGKLARRNVDLRNGWLDYPRPKTGVCRRSKLWPCTVRLLDASLSQRPTPKNDADAALFFLTKYGASWSKDTSTNPVSQAFAKVLRELNLKRDGQSYYLLRHVFRTVADGAKDRGAADHAMGHCDQSMASVYVEGIDDARLEALADHVHRWLHKCSMAECRK